MRRALLIFAGLALLYAGLGFLPGRTFAPLDLAFDSDAWKADPARRVRVTNTLLGDVLVQFVPWDYEILRLARRGELPWTNVLAGDGSPLFANPQTALFSPFTWPRLLLGLDGWAFMAFLKLFAAAACMYWFARELEIAPRQAIVSGLVYATAGYTVVWLLFPITHVFALLPGLAAAAWRLVKVPAGPNAALVILFAALCTAGGHPETLFIGVIAIAIFLVWQAEKGTYGLAALIPSAIGALLGFLLLAIQVIPFLNILGDTHAQVARPAMPHPFRAWAVASQILPGILGTPLRGELDLTAVPGTVENFNLRVGGYVGALVLFALLLAARDLPVVLKRGLVIGSVALVISWFPPGLWPIARNIPVLRVLTLEYLAAIFVFFAALAAGPAIAIAAARRRRKAGGALLVAGVLVLFAGLLPLLPAARPALQSVARQGVEQLRARGHLRQPAAVYEERLSYYLDAAGFTTLRRAAIPGACWALAGAALLLPITRRAALLSGAAVAELIAFGFGFNPAVRMETIAPAPEPIVAVKRLDPANQFLIATHFEVFPANLGTLYGVRDAVSYDALTTQQRAGQLQPAGFDPLLHTFNPILGPEQISALAPLGVRFVLSRHDVHGLQRIAGGARPAVGVYEVPDAIPLAMPVNAPPPGLMAGAIVSLIALLLSAGWLRLYKAPASQEP